MDVPVLKTVLHAGIAPHTDDHRTQAFELERVLEKQTCQRNSLGKRKGEVQRGGAYVQLTHLIKTITESTSLFGAGWGPIST